MNSKRSSPLSFVLSVRWARDRKDQRHGESDHDPRSHDGITAALSAQVVAFHVFTSDSEDVRTVLPDSDEPEMTITGYEYLGNK
ncbi:MAG: hypothetical protein R2725_03265 [Solirubrobacterales bacterium]